VGLTECTTKPASEIDKQEERIEAE
jgi:hypothetical protein